MFFFIIIVIVIVIFVVIIAMTVISYVIESSDILFDIMKFIVVVVVIIIIIFSRLKFQFSYLLKHFHHVQHPHISTQCWRIALWLICKHSQNWTGELGLSVPTSWITFFSYKTPTSHSMLSGSTLWLFGQNNSSAKHSQHCTRYRGSKIVTKIVVTRWPNWIPIYILLLITNISVRNKSMYEKFH